MIFTQHNNHFSTIHVNHAKTVHVSRISSPITRISRQRLRYSRPRHRGQQLPPDLETDRRSAALVLLSPEKTRSAAPTTNRLRCMLVFATTDCSRPENHSQQLSASVSDQGNRRRCSWLEVQPATPFGSH